MINFLLTILLDPQNVDYTCDSSNNPWERTMTTNELEALDYLVEKAKHVKMTKEQTAAQRKSFAYGNSAFENPQITKERIEEEAERIGL